MENTIEMKSFIRQLNDAGLKNKTIAEYAGVSQNTLSAWRTGNKRGANAHRSTALYFCKRLKAHLTEQIKLIEDFERTI